MPITRKKLVDRFQEIVHQEILNNAKQIDALHNKIVSCNEQIKKISDKVDEFERKLINQEQNLKIYQDHISKEVALLTALMDKKLNDLIRKSEDLENRVIGIASENLQERNRFLQVEAQAKQNKEQMRFIQNQLDNMKKLVEETSDYIRRFVSSSIDRLKEWVHTRPSGIEEVTKELHRKIESNRVEKDGIDQEFKIIKRSMVVHQKQIENIYRVISKIGGSH